MRLAVIFPLAQTVYLTYLQEYFDLCFQTILNMYGLDIKNALYGEEVTHDNLKQTMHAQCSIFSIEYCLQKLWASLGVHPTIVVGHSLGEFAAATAASLITFEDALKIVGGQYKLVETLSRGKMLAVSANSETCLALVSEFLKERPSESTDWMDIAAYNTDRQTTLSGPFLVIDEFAIFCQNNAVKATILDASHAFHSRALDPMLNKLEDILKTIKPEVEKPNCKFISSVDGTLKSALTPE